MRDNTIRQAADSDGSDTKTSLRARSLEHRPALNRAPNNCAGFTLVELLVLTWIIAVLIGAGLPAVQKQRESVARTEAANNLRQAGAAFQAFYDRNGKYPETWKVLADWCELHPRFCGSPYILPFIEQEGLYKGLYGWQYSIVRITLARSSNSTANTGRPPFQLEAEPIYPGVTGSETLVLDQNGNLTSFPTPGADEGRQRMFEGIRATGAETIAELLNRDRSALPVIRDFVGSPESLDLAFDKLDSDDNGLVSFDEILNLDTGSEISIAEFLNSVNREMRLDLLSPEMKRTIGVRLSELRGNPAEIFSFDGLCSLTRLYISAEEIANQLCARLMAAEAAAARGDSEAKARFLRAYINEVEAQAHRTLTRRKATTLITLAQTL